MTLDLPAVLSKGDLFRVAHTATDYWTFVYDGWQPTGEKPDEDGDLTPQQKAARTRAAKKAKSHSNDGEGETDTQGSAAGEDGGDLTSTSA